jgi:hypothetical protein
LYIVHCTLYIVHCTLYIVHCTVGYSDFHNLMGFTSKKMPNNILKNVCKKIFLNWLSHFLPICIILVPNKTHIRTVHNDPKIFLILFLDISIQNTQNFTLISNP